MNCEHCNNPLPDEAKFCGNCGKSVSKQALTEEKAVQIPVENKSPQSATKIVRKSSQVVAVILLLGLISSNSSTQTAHPTGTLGIIFDICYIFGAIMLIALLSEWWKNRKSDKQWFGRRWIIFIIVISAVGLATQIINQSLITARQKGRFQELLQDTDKRVENWLEIAERGFNFAEKAATVFATAREKNDPAVKKEIFGALGSNYILTDGKLSISWDNLLFPIQSMATEIRNTSSRLELQKKPANAKRLGELYSKNPRMLRDRDSNPSDDFQRVASYH